MADGFATWLQREALAAGGLAAGCLRADSARVDAAGLRRRYDAWLASGNAGALGYVERALEPRVNPFGARPWARSAVVVMFAGDWASATDAAAPANPAAFRLAPAALGKPAARVSRYAAGRDYHGIGEGILRQLEARLASGWPAPAGTACLSERCVDVKPAPEVALAVAAGLGVLGRNGLLRTPQRGCRVHVGVLFSGLDLPEVIPAPAVSRSCADCGLCVRRCPTGALDEASAGGAALNRVRRCRSWLSMEWRGALSREQQAWLGDALFGCDACTSCCPERSEAGPAAAASGMAAGLIPAAVDPEWLLTVPAGELRRRIAGTALEHAGTTLLKRNAAAILGNTLCGAARQAWRERLLSASRSAVIRDTVRNWEEDA